MPRKSTILNPTSIVSELFISLTKVDLAQALAMKHKVSLDLIFHLRDALNEYEQAAQHIVLWPALHSSRKSFTASQS